MSTYWLLYTDITIAEMAVFDSMKPAAFPWHKGK